MVTTWTTAVKAITSQLVYVRKNTGVNDGSLRYFFKKKDNVGHESLQWRQYVLVMVNLFNNGH